jgi:hypothetical protein
VLRRFVSERFQVLFHSPPGVLFTFPSRYLSAIGHLGVFRLTRWSSQIHTGFLGPRATWDTHPAITTFRLRGWHPLWLAFQSHSSISRCNRRCSAEQPTSPTTPIVQRLPAITHDRFGLFRFRSPLLTESRLLSLPVGTEMFHFPTFPLPALYIQAGVTGSVRPPGGVSPFGHPRIRARLSAPRGLSQIATSFFGSRCQGIHRSLLET